MTKFLSNGKMGSEIKMPIFLSHTVGQPEGALNGPLWARNHMSDSRYLLLISFSGARLGLPFIVN